MTGPFESDRAAFPGHDHEGSRCTVVVYALADVVQGRVVRVIVIAPDATERGACALPPALAVQLADAIHAAVGNAPRAGRE